MKNTWECVDAEENRLKFLSLEQFDDDTCFKDHVRDGLLSDPKFLCSSSFYDYNGSSIFDKICELPEYYLTRSEISILENSMEEIIAEMPTDGIVAELGNGSPLNFFSTACFKGKRAFITRR